MLKLASNGGAVINTDDFYIYHKSDGLDQLIFNLSIYDENYPKIVEEAVIEYGQPYLVKAIDGGSDTAKIKCEIDLDELKATLNVAYTNGSATLQNTITNVLPEGWTLMDESGVSIRRTIEGAYTPYDVIMECPETYGIVLQFDAKNRIVHTYDPTKFQPLGSFVSRDLNLKELNYKGKSTGFYTRLYAYGKDGLSFADINDGKPYVDCNTYTDKIICAYWQDDRYEIAENLMEDAQATVDAAGVPQRSYECTVYDLAKTNPDMYGFEDFAMFSVVKLIDDIKGVSLNYQVAELWEYPYYPEKNVVTLSSATPKIQNTVQSIDKSLKPNGTIWNGIQSAQQAASNIINGVNGGYVVFHSNAAGQIYEILVMDQPSTETATKVWRWNQNGFGYSPNGYDGPYTAAITMDGKIVATFMTTGVLQSADGKSYWNMDTGELQLSGIFQQFNTNGYKSVAIQDNEVSVFAWQENGDYCGGLGALKGNGTLEGRTMLGLYVDNGDVLFLGYENPDDPNNKIPVISFDSTNTNSTPYIINTISGKLFPNNSNGGVEIENGLVKNVSLKAATGTIFPNNPSGGIVVKDGLIEEVNIGGITGTVNVGTKTLTISNGLVTGVS